MLQTRLSTDSPRSARRFAAADRPRRRGARWPATALLVLLAALLPACDGDSTDPDDDDSIVGTWDATSFTAAGVDFIAEGMSVTATFNANGSYTINWTDDEIGTCDPGPDCTETGTYTTTATTITLEPSDDDPVTFNYDVDDDDMTFNGSIDGIPATITWERQ